MKRKSIFSQGETPCASIRQTRLTTRLLRRFQPAFHKDSANIRRSTQPICLPQNIPNDIKKKGDKSPQSRNDSPISDAGSKYSLHLYKSRLKLYNSRPYLYNSRLEFESTQYLEDTTPLVAMAIRHLRNKKTTAELPVYRNRPSCIQPASVGQEDARHMDLHQTCHHHLRRLKQDWPHLGNKFKQA